MRRVTGILATMALAASLSACATAQPAAASAVQAAPVAAADPFAAQRPTAAGVDVVQPAAFAPGTWMNNSYIDHVTQFATLPSEPGGIAFVGDSITEGFRWSEAFPGRNIRNWGIGGDTSFGVLARARQVIATRPAKIFLLIGTNDLANYEQTPDAVAANVAAVVALFRAELPEAELYVQSVMPRQPDFRARIEALNAQLATIAQTHDARFIDVYTPMLAGDRLDPTLTVDDLHLTGQGYQRWLSIIGGCVTGQGRCG
ncbi:hypothetical protein BZG35_10105 [Brevundimonas sp. LM2]|uniref:GDSL-type esterase/lipase family protein n=1 Tax=Brevundimonas sp. LM2 TaxID=1938605 RepID=UPI000983BB14|nr:GDSL-type esterase/lipase family protein [Brevundimonas sp. LM2]AQR61963.1 hypothetical protein BZG35_10105 [Brevundimonas sp. LM2]